MNSQPNQLEMLDSAMDLTIYITHTLEQCLDGEKSADLYGCTIANVLEHLAKLKIDLVAAGATTQDYSREYKDVEETEYPLPTHQRDESAERMAEIADDRRAA